MPTQLDSIERNQGQVDCKSEALLLGRIYDDRGHKMTPSHVRKRGIKYRYYISTALLQGQSDQLVIDLANARGADPKRKRSRNVIECLGTRHHQPDAAKFSRPKPDRFKTRAPSVTL
jgi:hypothetical protein